MNIQEHFENEVRILKEQNKDLIIDPYLKSIQDIIDTFTTQGHSGFSGSFTRKVICDSIDCILNHKPLSPIQGTDDEWNDVSEESCQILFQNKRDSSVFKSDTETYFIDGIVWENIADDNDSFTGNVQGIDSSVPVKFPLRTKTFRVKVKRFPGKCEITGQWLKDHNNEEYHYEIDNWQEIKEVQKYYDFEF